jgi:hypothetical protein
MKQMEPTPFDRFQSLARRILTTPKADLVKSPKVKEKPQASKRKGKRK